MQPGQQKITQFDEVTSTQSGDIIPIVRGGQNKKISVENFTGVLPEGWLTPAEAWTFASFGNGVGVITIPEGNINRYPNGTRVWFKQGTPTATDRYGVVIGSTTTALTVAMIAGTTLQNLTIQQPAVSSEIAPRTSQNVDFMMLDSYSTSETPTSQRWVNGKIIYKKTIAFGSLPNNASKDVAHGIADLDFIIKYEGMAYSGSSYFMLPLVSVNALSAGVQTTVSKSAINITTGQDRSMFSQTFITLYYTK